MYLYSSSSWKWQIWTLRHIGHTILYYNEISVSAGDTNFLASTAAPPPPSHPEKKRGHQHTQQWNWFGSPNQTPQPPTLPHHIPAVHLPWLTTFELNTCLGQQQHSIKLEGDSCCQNGSVKTEGILICLTAGWVLCETSKIWCLQKHIQSYPAYSC
jgi:hypothetical protein